MKRSKQKRILRKARIKARRDEKALGSNQAISLPALDIADTRTGGFHKFRTQATGR